MFFFCLTFGAPLFVLRGGVCIWFYILLDYLAGYVSILLEMSEIEDLQLELDALLCHQSIEKLLELSILLKVKESIEDKSRSQLVKIIRNAIEEAISNPTEDFNVDTFLRDTISNVKGSPSSLPKSEEQTRVQQEISYLEKQLDDLRLLQLESDKTRKTLSEQLRAAKQKVTETSISDSIDSASANLTNPAKSETVKPGSSVLLRDFKISGQIGEPGQHDKLTYVSLIHQIDTGLERGYSEKEVCDAIIKSISPHSSLRNYILTLPQRSLGKLRSILRVFFQEKTAADLFQAMVTTVQEPKETAQQFLLRLLDSRNRVSFASKEENAESEYSSQLVEKSFLKAFESGLRDENLVTNLRPFLRKSDITDDELMRSVNDFATKQSERKAKIGAASERTKAAKAQAITVENEKQNKQSPNIPRENSKVVESETSKLSAEIQYLKSQLAEIKQQANNSARGNLAPRFSNRARGRWRNRYSGPPRYSRLACCRTCHSNGTTEQCDHCFQCGEHGHFRSQCPHFRNQGNLPRLFQGGVE